MTDPLQFDDSAIEQDYDFIEDDISMFAQEMQAKASVLSHV